MEFNIYANGQLMNAEQFKHLTVSYVNGRPVHLEDVANVIDSVQDDKQASWIYTKGADGKDLGAKRTVTLSVLRQPGTNTIEVTDRVRALLPLFQAQLPPALKLLVRGDRSVTIRTRVSGCPGHHADHAGAGGRVIFFFLRNVSATTIPSLALPFTILGTFAVMAALDFSLDNMSMMALILAIGFIVDDAIVMLENIVRHIEAGRRAV